ncbi:MAG: hypothetical protein GC154_13360 [bacterium]|nr:hypothetical protein [bacterium]
MKQSPSNRNQLAAACLALMTAALCMAAGCGDWSKDKNFGLVEMFHGSPKPPRMMPRSILGSMPSGPFESQEVRGILIMDSGADYTDQTALTYLAETLERYNPNGRGDLPVHYFIDKDGVIYAGRQSITPASIHQGSAFTMRPTDLEKPEDLPRARLARVRNPELKLKGYLVIMMLGDYDNQLVNEKQEKSLFQLVAYELFRYNMPIQNVVLLSQLYPETRNPGFYLKNYLNQSTLEANLPPPPSKHRFLIPPPGLEER